MQFELMRSDAHRYSGQQVIAFVAFVATASDSLRAAWLASPWANKKAA
jgi:hypothetical protein